MSFAPTMLAAIGERVERCLIELLDHEDARWTALAPELAAPLNSVRSLLMAGGKRLRPAFCHWGFIGAGGHDGDPASVRAGAAFELLQAFALFHDDVMDGSSTRRGERTVHLEFSDLHQAEQWTGEARRFGEGVAILVGDLAFVYADQLLTGAPPAAIDIWNELRIELNIGQYLDIVGTARRERDRGAAERIARYKSGKYTIERPLHLGAMLVAPERRAELLPALSAYGLPLGDAFQLRDDVLGAFGDEATTGKPVGDDLVEGKPTPLLAIATARANAPDLETLDLVGRPGIGDREVTEIQQVLVNTGALAELEQVISDLAHSAIVAIHRAPISLTAQDELEALARYVAWREK
jgi:geranylgeranyl diphosphate synthase, type I